MPICHDFHKAIKRNDEPRIEEKWKREKSRKRREESKGLIETEARTSRQSSKEMPKGKSGKQPAWRLKLAIIPRKGSQTVKSE